jgi:hypothetical protein
VSTKKYFFLLYFFSLTQTHFFQFKFKFTQRMVATAVLVLAMAIMATISSSPPSSVPNRPARSVAADDVAQEEVETQVKQPKHHHTYVPPITGLREAFARLCGSPCHELESTDGK